MTKGAKKSSQRWLQEHTTDTYVKQANQLGFRSRAVYKLAQIDERDHLLRPGMTIVELGAAPGGWSQWIKRQLKDQVSLIALDILPIAPLPGVTVIQGDFREQAVLDILLTHLQGHRVDLVLSDMSPNISGIKAIDQPRGLLLAELARDLALQIVKPGGHLVTKVFQGEGFDDFLQTLKPNFQQVVIRKPEASRARSPELYIVAKQYRASIV